MAAPGSAFDLSRASVHLGLGARAEPVPDFEWTPDFLQRYEAARAADGDEGRLVCLLRQGATWNSWERHPAGEELVVLLSGCVDLIQEVDGETKVAPLHHGAAVVNPAGVVTHGRCPRAGRRPLRTPGRGTEIRPR